MIDCRKAAQHLYEYVDRELDAQTAEEIQEHLKCCGDCFDVFDLEAKLKELVREKAAHSPAADELKARILAELEKVASQPRAVYPRRVWMWAGGAAAAAALVLLYVFGVPNMGGEFNPLVAAAAAEHQNHLAVAAGGLPEGFSVDSVDAILKSQLGFDPEVNQLKEVCKNLKAFHAGAWSGKPAACLYLISPEGDRISFFISKEARGSMPKGKKLEQNGKDYVGVTYQGLQMVFWEWDGMLCCMTGKVPEKELLAYSGAV